MKSPLLHIILACSVCVATMIGYGFWYATVGAKSIAVANLESQISEKTEAASRIASARASLAEIAGDEASMQNYFVPETGVVAFINNLEAQGRAQGASVSVLSVSTSGAGAQPTLTFSITIKGTFDAVMRTVGAIEYAPYDLSISALSLGQEGSNSWHANLNLLVGSVSASIATSTP
jgi:hypothetical protein